MEAAKILHQLTYAEGLPREALKAATAQREEMLPLFIGEIEAFLAELTFWEGPPNAEGPPF